MAAEPFFGDVLRKLQVQDLLELVACLELPCAHDRAREAARWTDPRNLPKTSRN